MKSKTAERKIVFVNQSTGYLTIDIINSFVKEFDRIALIAGSIRVQNTDLDSKVVWSKITVYQRSSTFKKALSWLLGTIQIFFLLITKYRKYEIFYVSVPPTAYLLSILLPNSFSLLIYDIYPDALKVYNISDQNFIYRVWQRLNKNLFSKAHRIFTLGEGMAKLLSKYTDHKINVIANWSDTSLFKPVEKQKNPFIKEKQLEGKFIVMYSGNIGYTHNVEVLISVAEQLKKYKDILFLIIGRGERTTYISSLIDKKQLQNCKMLPFQPDDILPFSLASADIAVITLADETALISVPSKTYNFLAVGAPLLCIAAQESEMNQLVSQFDNGKCFDKSDINQMADYILALKNDESYLSLSQKNSRVASYNFTSKNALLYLEQYV